MLDYSQAHDSIELLRRKRQLQDIPLCNAMVAVNWAIECIGLNRRAQVNRSYLGAGSQEDFRESPGSTTAFQDMLSAQTNPEGFAKTPANAISANGLSCI